MCGIAGYYGEGNLAVLEKMTRTIHYRGPDDEGFFVDGEVGLGQRRLKIIDLSERAHQPMSNEDGTVWITFNGEIYNFKELRKTLDGRHNFKSDSDTEVIIHLYEEAGLKAFERLSGMFALAIYDKRANRLVLARDRLGKKPLYWAKRGRTLIFGSELKALLPHPLVKKELDPASLDKYLYFGYVPTPHSIMKDIKKLEPASYLVYSGQGIEQGVFWEIKFESGRPAPEKTEALKGLDEKINQAVKARLVSDVPLGIFLSGGIDSSTIAYYAQKNSVRKIKTFSIGFAERSFDEAPYARRVARYLGTDHSEKILSAKDCLDLIPRVADLADEPLADASLIPTYLLAKFTRESVTVALGGDGGDEIFCGYDTFVAHRLAEYYGHIPEFLRKHIVEKIALNLPVSHKNISLDFKAKSFIRGFYGAREYRDARWMQSFGDPDRAGLLKPEIREAIKGRNVYEDIDRHRSDLKDGNFFHQLIKLYLRLYLMDDILVKTDRASMYNSLEVRAPFLDYGLVDYANSLPLDYKLKGFKTKYLLKLLMADKLPREIVNRKKKGFGIPIARWLAGELKGMVLEKLNKTDLESQGLFNYPYIEKILNDHFSGRQDNRLKIYNLLVFELWREKWLK